MKSDCNETKFIPAVLIWLWVHRITWVPNVTDNMDPSPKYFISRSVPFGFSLLSIFPIGVYKLFFSVEVCTDLFMHLQTAIGARSNGGVFLMSMRVGLFGKQKQ